MPQVSPQVSQIAPAAADARSAPQRKGGGFAQLLDTADAAPAERDAPRTREADDAEPVRTRRRMDHAGRRNDTRAERQDAKTDAGKSDRDQDETAASGDTKSADASAADQPKKHIKSGKDGKDAADAAADPQAAESVQAPDGKVAAVQAAAAPAPVTTGTNDVPVQPADALAGIEAPQPQQAAPAQAAAPQVPSADAPQFDAAMQAAGAAQPAAGTADAQSQTAGSEAQAGDGKTPPQAAKNIAALAPQTNNAAPAMPKPADAPKFEQPAPDISAVRADAGAKPADGDANAAKPETLESALAKQFGGTMQITDGTPITLPDAARALQNHLTPASVAVQTSASAAANQPVPLQNAALAIEIASRATNGARQFEIRLDPPELGRIDVKLDVDKGGNVNTHLTVDRPETLDLLRRDSQGLERALQQAGLKTSDGNLEFSLRQQTPDGFGQRGQGQAQQGGNANGVLAAGTDSDTTSTVHAEYQWAARLRGGVDIRV